MDLNKHIVTNDTNKPFHSNGFAQIAVGNRVGSTDKTSFNQRQQIECNRRLIYGYNRSVIGSAYGVQRIKPAVNNEIKNMIKPSLQQHNSQGVVSNKINNPKPQNYNPYA